MTLKTINGVAVASVKTVNGIAKASVKSFLGNAFPAAGFAVDSADFDGTNDYMASGAGLTGAADSTKGIFSTWVRLDGGNATNLRFIDANTTVGGSSRRFGVYRDSNNLILVSGNDAAGSLRLLLRTSNFYTAGATLLHVLSSWDTATAGASHLYISDVSDKIVSAFNGTSDIDYTTADWGVGASSGGVNKLNGCLAELYFAPGQYLDFSVEANRRKFIDASGKPVDLGSDGSTPTGTAPLVYLHLDDGESVANFATNRGTGGNFTITGALDTGSSSPTD